MPRETCQHEDGARPGSGRLLFVLDECRDLFEEIGQTIHQQRYEDIILQAVPPEYERERTASYERRDFGLDGIRHMMHTIYADNISHSVNAQSIAGRGIARQVVGHTSSGVQCNHCTGFIHVSQDCAILKKDKDHRRGPNPKGQHRQRKQHLPRHGKAGPRDARRGGDINQLYSFHESSTHRIAKRTCHTQHGVGSANAGDANNAANYIDHPISFTAVEASTEEENALPIRSNGRTSRHQQAVRIFWRRQRRRDW